MNKKKLSFLIVSIGLMTFLLAAGVFGQAVEKDNVYRYLSIFTEVFSIVRTNYVEDVTPDELVEGAFIGLTDAIDEFSYYVPPALMSGYRDYVEPDQDGIGAVVSRRFGYGYVLAVLEGSPADKAGVEAGDFVEMIDGKPTEKMALWQIRGALHGKPGSKVELTLLRGGMAKRETTTVERVPRTTPPVSLEVMGDVAYIKIPFFGPNSAEQFEEALADVKKKNIEKVIVDLRNNAGGSVEEAISSADAVLKRGTITSLAGRRTEAKSWTADSDSAFDGKLLVLADQTSASGAEIFAAAVSDNQRGRVVGLRTYGKAIVQRFVKLQSGGGLLVTIGNYATPSAKPIKEEGVKPDVLVDLTPLAVDRDLERDEERDLILERALEIMAEVEEKAAA